jgi:hypothetical protein
MWRSFRCPACGCDNGFFTLMYAYSFVLKLVPGPEPDRKLLRESLCRRNEMERERRRAESAHRKAAQASAEAIAVGLAVWGALLRQQQVWPYFAWILNSWLRP